MFFKDVSGFPLEDAIYEAEDYDWCFFAFTSASSLPGTQERV